MTIRKKCKNPQQAGFCIREQRLKTLEGVSGFWTFVEKFSHIKTSKLDAFQRLHGHSTTYSARWHNPMDNAETAARLTPLPFCTGFRLPVSPPVSLHRWNPAKVDFHVFNDSADPTQINHIINFNRQAGNIQSITPPNPANTPHAGPAPAPRPFAAGRLAGRPSG